MQIFKPLLSLLMVGFAFSSISFAQVAEIKPSRKAESRVEAFRSFRSNSVGVMCQLRTLQRMGWTIQYDSHISQVELPSQYACNGASQAEAQALGLLTLRLPAKYQNSPDIYTDELESVLRPILTSKYNLCAYKQIQRAGAIAAAQKLYSNPRYVFAGENSLISFLEAQSFWSGAGNRYQPASSVSAALRYIENAPLRSDCAVGVQLMQYSTLLNTYQNDAFFQSKFNGTGFTIGDWRSVVYSPSVVYGSGSGREISPGTQFKEYVSDLGSAAFSGIYGYIGNVYGESYLDSPNDRNENFVYVNVSPKAGAYLARDGLDHYSNLNQEIWKATRGMTSSVAASDVDGILGTHPVYNEVSVFVHPLGVQTLGHHMKRLLQINPRTPYTFGGSTDPMNAGAFDRFVQQTYEACGSN